MFDEAKKSLEKNLNDKFVSPFWGAFIASWCVWNWKAWYATFFIDSNILMQSKNILKIDYILSFYPSNHCYLFFYSLIPPLIASYFIVFWLPKITKYYYERALDFEYENKIIKEQKEKKFLIAKGEKLESEKRVLKEEKEIKEIKSEKSQEDEWNKEYDEFKKTKYYQAFNEIKECIYEHDGWTEWNNKKLSADIKAFFDSNKIIEKEETNNRRIALTEKGKYFMRKYTKETQ
jgi:hypothetical protein